MLQRCDPAHQRGPGHRAAAIADGVINHDGLGFFAAFLLGDDPEAEKQRLRDGFARLAAEVDFEHPARPRDTDRRRRREQLKHFAAAYSGIDVLVALRTRNPGRPASVS